jgi:hypothetical protein
MKQKRYTKHKMNKNIIWLCFLVFAGCNKPEPIPAYLRIEPFVVNALGGAAAQDISSGWLYVNGEFLGAYSLPATVPVLAEGNSNVEVYPGVLENGIANTPGIFPFLRKYTLNTNLTPAQTTTVRPVTDYDPRTIFPFELPRTSFDGASSIFIEDFDNDKDRSFVLNTEGGFTGRGILGVVDREHPQMRFATETFTVPATFANEVWLELQHQNDIPFVLVLLGTGGNSGDVTQPVYQFNPQQGWNKIYFNLTEFLINTRSPRHRLLFAIDLPRNAQNQFTQDKGTVKLDNIRLLHF